MADEKFEEKVTPPNELRAYEAPTVRDFFQPLVVLGTTISTGPQCQPDAKRKPPKF